MIMVPAATPIIISMVQVNHMTIFMENIKRICMKTIVLVKYAQLRSRTIDDFDSTSLSLATAAILLGPVDVSTYQNRPFFGQLIFPRLVSLTESNNKRLIYPFSAKIERCSRMNTQQFTHFPGRDVTVLRKMA